MTSIMKYRTKFSGACQCHRMLMSSSGSVAPISVYIYNIHIYYMYVFDIYVEMIYSCITIKHQGFCITQRNSAFWYESIMAVLFTLYSCPCILMSVNVFETNFFYCDLISAMRSRTCVYTKPTICSMFATSIYAAATGFVSLYHLFIGQ